MSVDEKVLKAQECNYVTALDAVWNDAIKKAADAVFNQNGVWDDKDEILDAAKYRVLKLLRVLHR